MTEDDIQKMIDGVEVIQKYVLQQEEELKRLDEAVEWGAKQMEKWGETARANDLRRRARRRG